MSDRSQKDKQMAANLKAKGIYHGKRMGSGTLCPPIPPLGEPGSAAYRRLMRKRGQKDA